MPTDEIQCVTPRQLAALLPCYPATYWRRLLAEGRVPGAAKIGSRWLVPVSAVRTLLERKS
jgi:Helix-turn-helix domain